MGSSCSELVEVSERELRPKFFNTVKTVYWSYMSLSDYVGSRMCKFQKGSWIKQQIAYDLERFP